MRVRIEYGREHLDLDVADNRLAPLHRQEPAPALMDLAAAMHDALEKPLGFPALRRALTPDDHVAIVIDEGSPRLSELLTPLLEHIAQAHVKPTAITLLCPPPAIEHPWLESLPEAYRGVHVEVHDPGDRHNLSYLATTRQGHRLYLNRTAVDADQLVVLSRRNYDAELGYGGAAGSIYPALSDDSSRGAAAEQLTLDVPDDAVWPLRREAEEAAWLLGAPFLVNVIPGAGDAITHIVAGLTDMSGESQRLLDARWRVTVDRPAETVVAGISGEPARVSFLDLARAAAVAARVAKPGGRVILLTQARPVLGDAADFLRQAEDPDAALQLLRKHQPANRAGAFLWASAAQQAKLYLLSALPADVVEELFGVPLESPQQVQRLLQSGGSVLLLPDADKTLAVVAK
jgi:nickel-dependent lactate racemase